MTNQITGPLGALVPLLTSIFAIWGLDSTTAGLAAGAVVAVGAAAWSWWSNRPKGAVATVASMKGTKVSETGTTITLVSPELREAAKAAATDVSGK